MADAEGPGQLTSAGDPVDDASRLRSDPEALLRLIEHPGAFRAVLGPADATRGWVDSASPFLVFAAVVQQAGRRTRRFSELDPVRLAGLLDAVPEAARPGVYRRLGDVTLFLAGVFPDYATTGALGPLDAGRLLRAARLPSSQQERLTSTPAMELWDRPHPGHSLPARRTRVTTPRPSPAEPGST